MFAFVTQLLNLPIFRKPWMSWTKEWCLYSWSQSVLLRNNCLCIVLNGVQLEYLIRILSNILHPSLAELVEILWYWWCSIFCRFFFLSSISSLGVDSLEVVSTLPWLIFIFGLPSLALQTKIWQLCHPSCWFW